MAAKDLDSSNIKKEELDDMTTCCICTEIYTDPKALPCIHTFCMKCIQEAGLKNSKGPGDEMPCPICRRMFKLPPEGFGGLPKNFFIENLIQLRNVSVKSATSRAVCDACLEDNKGEADKEIPVADAYCVECKSKLCEKCSVEHRKFKFTRSHKLIQMSEYEESQKVKTIPAPSVCELHEQKVLDIYCAYCKTVVCAICFIDDHTNHDGSHVSKFVDGFQKQIEINAKAINECRSKAENKKAEFLKVKENMLKSVENLECDVEKRKDELKQLTDKHAIALLESLSAIKQTKLKEFEMATFDIDTYISSLETCNSYSLKMIARGSPADICREFSYLSVRAMELQEQCQPMIEREIQSLNYILRKSDLEEFMQESCDSMIGEIEEEGDSKLKIRNVASKLAEQSKEIDRLRIEIETEKSEKERLRLLNDQLKITTNKEIHASKALKEELDKEKAKYDSGIEKLMQELDKNRATICILQENNDKLKQELDAGKMPKNSLQKDADEIREKLDKEIIANTTAQNDRDKLKQDLDNEKLTNKSVNIKNTNPVEKVSTYETPIKTLEDNAEKLKEELVTNKRDDVLCSYKSDPVLIHTITGKETGKKMKEIRGMTVLNRELFVLNEKSSTVHVYDSVKFTYRRQWDLKRLIRPEDIASCDRNKCLYIVDYKGFNKSKVIFRVEANGTPINNWSIGGSVGPAWEGSLSVTDESNVVLTLRWNDTINEYSSDGKLIRLINLSSDDRICNPNHAIKLANGHFLVSEGTSDLHRVCVVNADGRLQKSFGGKSGSNIGQMNGPTHLSIDRNGFVMVLDEWNSRVLLLDSDLNFYKEILPKEKYELDYRVRKILLDQSNGRLFVAQNEGLFNIDGKIMIFQIDVTK